MEINNYENICRTCLREVPLQSVFTENPIEDDENNVKHISDILMECTSVKICKDDILPLNICSECINQLIQVYKFRKKCENNEKILEESRQYYNDNSNSDIYDENDIINQCDTEHVKSKRHPMKRDHKCDICLKSFTTSQLKIHMRVHTKERPFTCTYCGQQFSLNCNLRRHVMLHTGEQPKKHGVDKQHTCEVCGQRFSFKCNLKRHAMRHTQERPHVCEICGRGFIQATNLVNHVRVHTNEYPFVCSECGRKFRQAERLRLHAKRHKDGAVSAVREKKEIDVERRTHVCEVCKKGYASKSALKTHSLIHGDKMFLCSECGKGFVSKPLLRSHSKIHSGIKPYHCPTCDRNFSHYVSLKAHTLVHTRVKPHRCSVCSKVFTQKHHLTYHMRTHSGERPFSCSYCGKTFSLNCNLTVHMRIHSGETPYVCDVCSKGFYDSSSLKKHRKAHGEI